MEFNIADLYESLADNIAERPALVVGESRLTFGELDQRANRMAHFFLARGVKPGDHVGLYAYRRYCDALRLPNRAGEAGATLSAKRCERPEFQLREI